MTNKILSIFLFNVFLIPNIFSSIAAWYKLVMKRMKTERERLYQTHYIWINIFGMGTTDKAYISFLYWTDWILLHFDCVVFSLYVVFFIFLFIQLCGKTLTNKKKGLLATWETSPWNNTLCVFNEIWFKNKFHRDDVARYDTWYWGLVYYTTPNTLKYTFMYICMS